jgi:hypothetical protein
MSQLSIDAVYDALEVGGSAWDPNLGINRRSTPIVAYYRHTVIITRFNPTAMVWLPVRGSDGDRGGHFLPKSGRWQDAAFPGAAYGPVPYPRSLSTVPTLPALDGHQTF